MTAAISPVELQTLLARGCTLIDVREPVEFAGEHITGAKLIPLGQLAERAPEILRDQPLVVMCRSGMRGGQALEKLRSLGFADPRNLEGGILAWKAAGLSVKQGDRKEFPLMQQVQIIIGVGVLAGVLLSRSVHPDFIWLSAFFGAGLIFAGTTGWCGLAVLLSKMPWNKVPGQTCCDPRSCRNG
jgi:rhodanese-related sulfurtransferase